METFRSSQFPARVEFRSIFAGQEKAAPQRTAARSRHCDRGVAGNLALAALPPELEAGFVHHAEAMQTPGRELSTMGIERKRAVQRDKGPRENFRK